MTQMRNLNPDDLRQRTVIEARRRGWLTRSKCVAYMEGLAGHLDMELLHLSSSFADPFGWGVTAHWKYSGSSLMDYRKPRGIAFFSVDIHSCRRYDDEAAAKFTWDFMRCFEMTYGPGPSFSPDPDEFAGRYAVEHVPWETASPVPVA